MCRLIRNIVCVSIISLSLSGCFGVILFEPEDCSYEAPSVHIRDIFWSSDDFIENSTKEEFLKDWGKPDEVVKTSNSEEVWVYNRYLWCGVVVVFVLPAPLILPVCDGFERIEFVGNKAISLHRRSSTSTTIFLLPPGFERGHPCLSGRYDYLSAPRH